MLYGGIVQHLLQKSNLPQDPINLHFGVGLRLGRAGELVRRLVVPLRHSLVSCVQYLNGLDMETMGQRNGYRWRKLGR